ncbi:MAG: AAA family ATPase [Planctomycetota bacterium]|nr:AAA family ATPase [Planctomycetota bacterium]
MNNNNKTSGAIIAFSGKGGSGKTTLAAMTLRELIRTGVKPVLAIDADPNATLGLMLGAQPAGTIADLRDRLGDDAKKGGDVSKQRLMDQYLAELLAEESGFDMLTMGRPEGPGCYCYVNGLLRRYLTILRKNYACVLVDCEAGMEYISRLVVDDVSAMVLVAEPTPVGLATAGRISQLAGSLPVCIRRQALAINKLGRYDTQQEKIPQPVDQVPNMDAVFHVPFDADLAGRCANGQPIDDEAGRASRNTVEQLVHWCIGTLPHAQQTLAEKELR